MNSLIQSERFGKILSITLDRSDKKNALTSQMYELLTQLFEEGDRDDTVAVIHITGSGDSFCAGNDIEDFRQTAQQATMDSPARFFLQQLHRQHKPIVAAVNGVAIGIGVTLLLHCDFVYAVTGARFRLPFVDLGLVPEGGSSALLPSMLGHRRAAQLLLAGQGFDAESAERWGIINEVCQVDQLIVRSWAMAELLSEKPPRALQKAKAMMKLNPRKPIAQVIDSEIDQFMACLHADEAQQILRAMLSAVKLPECKGCGS